MSDFTTDGRFGLNGSGKLNNWRAWHKSGGKDLLSSDLDASIVDGSLDLAEVHFTFIEKNPYRIVAILELKERTTDKGFTFCQSVMMCDFLSTGYPIYYVEFTEKNKTPHHTDIHRVLSINPKPDPPIWELKEIATNITGEQFFEWERELRKLSKQLNYRDLPIAPRPPFTLTLTFQPSTFRWLLESAFRMATKERGPDSLIFIINGAVTPFPNHPINYNPKLANDLSRLVEDYASIKVETLT